MATKRQPNVASFTMEAFKFLTEPLPADFFEELPEGSDRVTSKKWWHHIEDLVKYKALLPTEERFLKHIAYYFGVPKKEKLARAVWNGRTLSRSCRYPPPAVNLPCLPDLLRRVVCVSYGAGRVIVHHDGRLHQLLRSHPALGIDAAALWHRHRGSRQGRKSHQK